MTETHERCAQTLHEQCVETHEHTNNAPRRAAVAHCRAPARLSARAAAEEIPQRLVDELKPGGVMVIPVGPTGGWFSGQVLTLVEKDEMGHVTQQPVTARRPPRPSPTVPPRMPPRMHTTSQYTTSQSRARSSTMNEPTL